MSKISFLTIKANNTLSAINENFNRIKQEMQDKLFYRNNTSGETNTLLNDVDANGNDVFNVASVSAETLFLNGLEITPITEVLEGGYVKTYNGRQNDVVSIPSDKAGLELVKADVGLSNVDNTSDVNKPVSVAQQAVLDLKAPIASPTFTGTVSGITKAMVGLGNVDDTSDVNKPVSTATQTALNLKLDNSAAAYFSAHNNSVAQSIPDATFTKVNFSTEKYDVGSAFASSSWTPPARPVQMNAQVFIPLATVGMAITVAIRKNGVEYKRGLQTIVTSAGAQAVSVVCQDVANGTDVYDVWVFQDSAGAADTAGTATVTYFQGTTLKP